MAKIPLRIYNREIENLIDRGQTEEAIAHCKHILEIYPKHIDTYRLMGKSFLESQRYGEAADIFQRVLSSVPDDFVSQVGMSIIREDEGNLDAAIWHMERAFEVQPANSAVQDELRRLYGRRDGLEPPKVRLTRGALVRMYARGDLYQQAIAEIRASLAEDPQRNDLQVLLARMYYLAGQKVEATESCSNLLAKFPYCYEANRILAEILPGTTRSEDTPIYQQRVAALDPYVSYISPNNPNVSDVADNAVNLERMEWNPANVNNQPQWAESLGIQIEQTEEQPMPDWLSTVSGQVGTKPDQAEAVTAENASETSMDSLFPQAPAAEPAPAETEEPIFPVSEDEAMIPDWMKEAGWVPSDGTEGEPTATSLEEKDSEEALPAANIPDWLQSMAPTPNEGQVVSGFQALQEESDFPDDAAASPAAPADIPDWLSGVIESPSLDDQPETHAQLPQEDFAPAETTPAEPADIPDWLSELKSAPAESAQEEQTPTSIPEPPQAVTAEPAGLVAPEIPDWLASMRAEAPAEPAQAEPETISTVEGQPAAKDQDDALAWLESLAAKHGADEETLFVPPDQRLENPPEWVQQETTEPADELKPPLNSAEKPEETPQSVQPAQAVSSDEFPDRLKDVQTSETVAAEVPPAMEPSSKAEPENPDVSAAAPAEIPAWLEGFNQPPVEETEQTPAAETELPGWLSAQETPSPTREANTAAAAEGEIEAEPAKIPDWLQALKTPQAVETSIEPEQNAAENPKVVSEQPTPQAPSSTFPSVEEQDAALAWLEGLAAKHGADEELMFVPPEQRTETPPQWVQEATAPVETPTPAEETSAIEPPPTISETPAEAVSELGAQEIPPAGAPEMPAVPTEEGALPEPASAEMEIPAVQENQEINQDEALAWLEGLAEKHGAEAETLYTKKEDRLKPPPSWATEAALTEERPAQEATTPSEAVQEQEIPILAPAEAEPQTIQAATQANDLPDWLADLEKDETGPGAVIPEKSQPGTAGEELPAWLQGETPETPVENPPQETTGQVEQSSAPGELPDWLQGLERETAEESSTDLPEVQGEPSNLPNWLQAAPEQPEFAGTAVDWAQQGEAAAETTPQEQIETPTEQPSAVLEKSIEDTHPVQIGRPAVSSGPYQDILTNARASMNSGNIQSALEDYAQLIESGQNLPDTIQDLREALYRYPVEITIWEKLGDAYARDNRLQDALDAYTKAEELLR